MKDVTSKRQKNAGSLKKSSWAIYAKKEFKELLDSIVVLVDILVKLFPAPQHQDRLQEEDLQVFDEPGEG